MSNKSGTPNSGDKINRMIISAGKTSAQLGETRKLYEDLKDRYKDLEIERNNISKELSIAIREKRKIAADLEAANKRIDELEHNKKLFRIFQDASSDGMLQIDIINNYCHISTQLRLMLGYTIEELPNGKDTWKAILYPDDIALAMDKFNNHVNDGDQFDCTLRYKHKNGNVIWMACRGSALRDQTGNAMLFVASHTNITPLREEQEKLKIATEAKSIFLATMTHEIRTPLNGIIGNSELLMAEDLPCNSKVMVNSIDYCSKLLLTLINNVLDYSKLEAGKMSLHLSRIDFRQCINETVEMLRSKAMDKEDLEIKVSIPSDMPNNYMGDSMRISQILTNLMGNAIKFTEKGYVSLSVSYREVPNKVQTHQITCCIEDTGIGIANENIPKLFQDYNQLDETITKRYGGTGLGLVISKTLCYMMGGKINVESELGKGSKFTFDMMLDKIHPDLITSSLEDLRVSPINLEDHHVNILVAEDNKSNQLVVQKFLEKIGVRNFKIVSDGMKAITAVSSGENYNIILMDVHMPTRDGYQATEAIRAMGYKYIPIIAMTANAMDGDKEKCLAAGMTDYISKPFTMKTLKTIIAKYIQ